MVRRGYEKAKKDEQGFLIRGKEKLFRRTFDKIFVMNSMKKFIKN